MATKKKTNRIQLEKLLLGKDKKEGDIQSQNFDYEYKKGEFELFRTRKRRWETMLRKKERLGINDKCARLDDLFTPHYTSLDNPDTVDVTSSDEFADDRIISEESRKSMPIAFEKVTSAQAIIVEENPKCTVTADKEKYKALNSLQKNVYYENFKKLKKLIVLKKYVYHLAKYGLGYWREYIKKTYKEEMVVALNKITREPILDDNNQLLMESKIVYDIFDVVGENIHPYKVVLDDNCYSVKDVNKPARDLYLYEYYSQDEFDEIYPKDIFPNAEFVREGQQHNIKDDTYLEDLEDEDAKKKIQVVVYENYKKGRLEKWANKVPLDTSPLPGGELSVNGDKWTEDLDNYDGIGVAQIIEIYQPLVDDIINASNERLRQIVRPHEDYFNGAEVSDESDDLYYGAGNKRKVDGDKGDIEYSRPPVKTDSEFKEEDKMIEEIGVSTGIPRNLSGTDEAPTAFQSAQNRESALKKLSLPLASVKKTIEDAANLDLKLYPIAYGAPYYTEMLKKGDEGWDEAMAILEKSEEKKTEDERVVVMELDANGEPVQIARRHFKSFELPVAMEKKDNKPTGRVVESEEAEFWEMIPKQFNWKGRIEIKAKSFLSVSKVLEDESDKATYREIMKIQTTDQAGNPTLMDKNGIPYTIDKVRVAKDFIEINERLDANNYLIPMNQENINNDNLEVGGGGGKGPSAKEAVGMKRPEIRPPESTSK